MGILFKHLSASSSVYYYNPLRVYLGFYYLNACITYETAYGLRTKYYSNLSLAHSKQCNADSGNIFNVQYGISLSSSGSRRLP